MGLAMNLFVIDGNCQIQGKVNGKGFEELNWKLHARRRAECGEGLVEVGPFIVAPRDSYTQRLDRLDSQWDLWHSEKKTYKTRQQL